MPTDSSKLFGRERPLHDILGGGRVADILLWRNIKLSGGFITGLTLFWLLLEVAEYRFVTLLCYILLVAMFAILLIFQVAPLLNWSPPDIYEFKLPQSICESFFAEVNWFLQKFYKISSGKDWKLFFLAIVSLFFLSFIGSCFSPLNLIFIVIFGMQVSLPLYERYEMAVDNFALQGYHEVKKLCTEFVSTVLDKIPRGQAKEKDF
ncbi:hypothetical protein FEM48_Zijuj10G0138500 [Ziziphus jujuba var. spinosa]|uniref:Reticulon-like protein n=1 Tax=Ziziphus jujuba var. spinosa TaxID=714518 RepID=A0A978UNR7_ZIZJJ|nr:reticulon-like protein B14 [Ziziphus jujuba var. spinosa]KAH7516469.1 hypothetical protein FEM48_Zijuj10G0138500 [Ziziphus jujuba var. spinosa]